MKEIYEAKSKLKLSGQKQINNSCYYIKEEEEEENEQEQVKDGCRLEIIPQVALIAKNLPASAGDVRDSGLIPESGRSPGVGNDNPLHILASSRKKQDMTGVTQHSRHRIYGVLQQKVIAEIIGLRFFVLFCFLYLWTQKPRAVK